MVLVKPFLLSALRYAKPACMSTCWSPVDKVTQRDGGLPTSAQKQQFLMALAQPFLLSALGARSCDARAPNVPLPGSSSSCLPGLCRVRLVSTSAMCW